MGAPSQFQHGASKFAQGFLGGLQGAQERESNERRQKAYLEAITGREAARNDARKTVAEIMAEGKMGAAEEYGRTRLGVADRGAEAKMEAARIAAEARKNGAPGSRRGPTFDQSKATSEALRAAGYTPRDEGGSMVPVDYSQMDPDQVSRFNTTFGQHLQNYNIANPGNSVKVNGEYLVPLTPSATVSTWGGLGKKQVSAKYGPNPEWKLQPAQVSPAGSATSADDF